MLRTFNFEIWKLKCLGGEVGRSIRYIAGNARHPGTRPGQPAIKDTLITYQEGNLINDLPSEQIPSQEGVAEGRGGFALLGVVRGGSPSREGVSGWWVKVSHLFDPVSRARRGPDRKGLGFIHTLQDDGTIERAYGCPLYLHLNQLTYQPFAP